MGPTTTEAGVKFKVQKNGESAIWVKGENFTPSTIIFWDNTKLKTAFADSETLTAIVPQSLYAKAGRYEISVMDKQTKEASNTLIFRVTEKIPLKLVKIGPDSTRVNQVFRVQPNGESAMWVKGTGITKSTIIVWENPPLKTFYRDSNTLTALVPKSLTANRGEFSLYLLEPKTNVKSDSLTFTVK